MRLLLDTQVMLWWLLDDPRLRIDTRGLLCVSPCVVSVASIWEVAIKHRLGKLEVPPFCLCLTGMWLKQRSSRCCIRIRSTAC
jgi:PIN domain nuclease of toxin-antitoxin system